MKTHDSLFSPFRLGSLQLPNRLVMAPMTRGRAEADGTPTPIMVPYYGTRAEAGLLVTEATAISRQAVGWLGAPGIYTPAHIAGWQQVTDAVHKAGGRIFLQLWHMGRVSHPDFLDGQTPMAPSAIGAKGSTHTRNGKQNYVTPRAMTKAEIANTIADYGTAAANAKQAGFDGVEIHGANGYLPDQFLRDATNQRTDEYGGSAANRCRFLLEATRAAASAWEPGRVGVRLSPTGTYNEMADKDPAGTFAEATRGLDALRIAYLHLVEPLPGHMMHTPGPVIAPGLRKIFRGPLILNGGYDAAKADGVIARKEADLVAFGVPFLANPDLVQRYRVGAPLNKPDFATLYTPGAKGYSDYPVMA